MNKAPQGLRDNKDTIFYVKELMLYLEKQICSSLGTSSWMFAVMGIQDAQSSAKVNSGHS